MPCTDGSLATAGARIALRSSVILCDLCGESDRVAAAAGRFDTTAGAPVASLAGRSPPVNRRSAIALTPAEQKEYVAGAQTLTLCTHGPHGYPHAVAMWFAVDDDGT